MPHTNYRTWQKHRVGYFLASVHLDPVADGHRLEQGATVANFTRQLLHIADSHRLPMTWAVSDPAYSAATPLIIRSTADHEVAILGDTNWLGPTAGRTRFARELVRRVSQARAAGIDVSSLVPRVAGVERHIDLVVKQQIIAISGVKAADGRRQLPVPRAIHFGVWELPITRRLHAANGRFGLALWTDWLLWRQIRTAAAAAAMYHLVIDAPVLAERSSSSLKTLGRLLRRVAELRSRGLVAVETLSKAAERLSAVPAVSSQQSILRRAA